MTEQLLGRGRPNIIDEKELLYIIKREHMVSLSYLCRHFKVGMPRMRKLLTKLAKQKKIVKHGFNGNILYGVL